MTMTNLPHRPAPADGRWKPELRRPAYPELNKPAPGPVPDPAPAPEPAASAPAVPPVPAQPPARPAPTRQVMRGKRIAVWGLGAAGASLAVAAISLAVQSFTTPDTVIVPVQPSATATPASTVPGFADGGPCTAITTATKVQGNGAGGTDSGPAAILAFEHAYYAERSGSRAREVVAPDGTVSPAETIQRGIDTIPVGTVHCVTITPQSEPGRWLVEIIARTPSGSSGYRQNITTTVVDGRTLITDITSAPR
ncbi:hypothetical protein ACWEVD_01225 [Nocardia thailandica]